MCKRLINHLDTYNVLIPNQFGFRKGLSTQTAIISLLNQIIESLDDEKYIIAIFLDLSKAFDTINHDILLSKLQFYGIRGNTYDWFRSYLSSREQFVELNGVRSASKSIIHGVPQGSVLGPILFLIAINDIVNS